MKIRRGLAFDQFSRPFFLIMISAVYFTNFYLLFGIFLQLSTNHVSSTKVTFDGRSFMLDGERRLFVAGSFHYPRAPRSEWASIFKSAKDHGINLIQAYVFWDIHEPENDQWNYPSDPSSNHNLVGFVQEAAKHDLFVHLRIAGYICAEWNFGGIPGWLRELNVTLRTNDPVWEKELSQFVEKTLNVVKSSNLLASQGGPIVMLQIENEYGNMEPYYGQEGVDYVKWLSQYALSLDVGGVPWVMCQQGEGVGTAPDAAIVNTCNGFYCDNWISGHAKAFPNQPHMFTELWPGWFQNWGEPVPHRPAVDVAFSVARWFARGGSYVNYYMVFGGTTYGREVGGPLIVTSYDYDVQIDEHTLSTEPKYTLLQQLHYILYENQGLLLSQMPPNAESLEGYGSCEAHYYKGEIAGEKKCIAFYSNWGEESSCPFTLFSGKVESVLPWSVSIGIGADCAEIIYNTKASAFPIPANEKKYTAVSDFAVQKRFSVAEPVPSDVALISSSLPMEQLSLTHDKTDYLWYSATLPPSASPEGVLHFTAGTAGGSIFYIYINKKLQVMVTGDAGTNPINPNSKLHKPLLDTKDFAVNLTVPLNTAVSMDILSVSMGLKNYGPFLEKIQVGIVSSLTFTYLSLSPVQHSVGLSAAHFSSLPYEKLPTIRVAASNCSTLCWHVATFSLPKSLSSTSHLALDMASMTKGSVWVNGHMLGRYWDITAKPTLTQGECSACEDYVGSYNGDKCRSGCGEPSQQYYKLPSEWLEKENVMVVFEEIGGDVEGIKLVEVSKVNVN